MSAEIQLRKAETVLVCGTDGPRIAGEANCTDLIGSALSQGASVVVVPVERLTEDFFRLRTGIAGQILQKFVNYRLVLAVLGDVSTHVAASTALRDFVYEANRGRHTWFLPNLEALDERLAA